MSGTAFCRHFSHTMKQQRLSFINQILYCCAEIFMIRPRLASYPHILNIGRTAVKSFIAIVNLTNLHYLCLQITTLQLRDDWRFASDCKIVFPIIQTC